LDNNILIDTEVAAAFRMIAEGEPKWLYRLRKDAWEYYLTSPPPERTTNVWRYTDPVEFVLENPEEQFDLLPIITDRSLQVLRQMSLDHSAFGYNQSDLKTLTQMTPELESSGVIFKDLYSAVRENRDLTENYLGKLIGPDFGKFEALNMALWNNGLFLYIPSNLGIDKPIYLHRHPTGKNTVQRLLVVIGENTQVTIIDDYACHCLDKGNLVNSAVELYAGDSSNVRYVNIQRFSADLNAYMTLRNQIGQNTGLKSFFGSVGGLVTKVNSGTILTGRGANSQMYGAIFGNEKQHFDYHTMQHHKSSDSFSNLNFKVVLKDKAMSAYTGLIKIEKDTVNCEAYQENRNLLLNPGTKAESIPELEILTDQVRCTHGATMGPIDPEQIFYLKCRGIEETEAVRMIVSGFMESLLGQIPDDIAKILRDVISVKLEGDTNGAGVR
jgi:Fe-S cluster assembly protein SufD